MLILPNLQHFGSHVDRIRIRDRISPVGVGSGSDSIDDIPIVTAIDITTVSRLVDGNTQALSSGSETVTTWLPTIYKDEEQSDKTT
jgi:hypothetical protein